jgi:membrane-associated phospholipid phosphatase
LRRRCRRRNLQGLLSIAIGRRSARWHSAALVFVSLALGASGRAEPISERRSEAYYWTHGGLTLGGFAAVGVMMSFGAPRTGGLQLFRHFGPDASVEHKLSASAADLSDRLLGFAIATPIAAQLSDGFDTRFGNAALIYTEAHSLSAVLTTATKIGIRRPRPYTQSTAPAAQALTRAQGSDAYVSFFSGHSSVTYTSAMAGSILYSQRTEELWARHTLWGLEFASAALTAQLRVRAGRHYRTDVWTGSLVGAGVGLLVPALHGVPLSRVRASEWATGAGAAALTILLTEVFDVCSTLGLCSADDDKPLSEGQGPGEPRALTWTIVPRGDAPGLTLLGEF